MTNAIETINAVDLDTGAQLLAEYVNADTPAMLWGPPGVGKSDAVKEAADARKIGFIDLRVATLEAVDLRGLPHVENNIAKWSIPDFFPREDRDGKEGIFFLDEINQNRDTFAACYQLVLNRCVGPHKLLPGWRIVAAGNRQGDRANAIKMPTALNNRLAHIDIAPDVDAWCKWAVRTSQSPLLIALIRWRPELLHIMPGAEVTVTGVAKPIRFPEDARAFPTPRQWVEASKHFAAPGHLRPRLVAGLLGEAIAMEAEGFIRTFLDLPKMADIMAEPDRAKVPSGPSALFAVSNGIAASAKPATIAPIMEYSKRLPKEFDFMTGKAIGDMVPMLKETAPYVAWAQRHVESI